MRISKFQQTIIETITDTLESPDGVTLRRQVEARTGGFVSIGRLYANLECLEESGIITRHEGERTPERGNRPKVYFSMARGGERIYELAEKE